MLRYWAQHPRRRAIAAAAHGVMRMASCISRHARFRVQVRNVLLNVVPKSATTLRRELADQMQAVSHLPRETVRTWENALRMPERRPPPQGRCRSLAAPQCGPLSLAGCVARGLRCSRGGRFCLLAVSTVGIIMPTVAHDFTGLLTAPLRRFLVWCCCQLCAEKMVLSAERRRQLSEQLSQFTRLVPVRVWAGWRQRRAVLFCVEALRAAVLLRPVLDGITRALLQGGRGEYGEPEGAGRAAHSGAEGPAICCVTTLAAAPSGRTLTPPLLSPYAAGVCNLSATPSLSCAHGARWGSLRGTPEPEPELSRRVSCCVRWVAKIAKHRGLCQSPEAQQRA